MSNKSKNTATLAKPSTCQFPFADGRHCRMPISSTHPYLCVFHADRERRLFEKECLESAPDKVAAELASLSGEIKTANDLNVLLTRLWKLIAARRIPPRTAATLAHLGGLLLQTLPNVKSEINQAHGYAEWERAILRSFPRRPALPPQLPLRPPSPPQTAVQPSPDAPALIPSAQPPES